MKIKRSLLAISVMWLEKRRGKVSHSAWILEFFSGKYSINNDKLPSVSELFQKRGKATQEHFATVKLIL